MDFAQPHLKAIARQHVDYGALTLGIAHEQALAGLKRGMFRLLAPFGNYYAHGIIGIVFAEALLRAMGFGYSQRACGREGVYLQIAIAELYARRYAAHGGLSTLALQIYAGLELFVYYALFEIIAYADGGGQFQLGQQLAYHALGLTRLEPERAYAAGQLLYQREQRLTLTGRKAIHIAALIYEFAIQIERRGTATFQARGQLYVAPGGIQMRAQRQIVAQHFFYLELLVAYGKAEGAGREYAQQARHHERRYGQHARVGDQLVTSALGRLYGSEYLAQQAHKRQLRLSELHPLRLIGERL